MIRKLILSIILSLIFMTSWTNASELVDISKGVWRLDGLDKSEVRNFRIVSSSTSASAQMSARSFDVLFEVLKRETLSNTPIYIVDLRQESHGFANGVPVSWYKEHNHANIGKSVSEIEQDEIERLKSILGKPTEFVPLGTHDKATLNKLTMVVENIQNEKYAAEQVGFKYIRFAAADMVFPDPSTVDAFIKFYLELPKNHWLHFHCHAGHGRTTTFLTFYDILRYPDLSLEEITQRQFVLGGTNLLAENNGTDWYSEQHRERAFKLRQFYQYVKEQRDAKFKVSWSEWLAGLI